MAEAEKAIAPVYVSWKTFQNSIDALSKAEIPNVIDKTVFPGMAFSVQNQLFTGMRFLGLIDEKNKPLQDLLDLANPVEEKRKEKLKEILQRRYSDLFAINLKKSTPGEVDKKMGESFEVVGDTKEKAVRFFLSASEYVGVELSPLLASKKPNGGKASVGRSKRGPRRQSQPPQFPPAPERPGTSKMVRLQSGGTLTISATLDLFALNPNDRKFVFDLIDRLDDYQQPTLGPTALDESTPE